MKLSRRHRMTGFTLLEVMIVVVIIAIVMAIAVMSFGDFGRARNAKITLQQLSHTVGVARQQAMLQQRALGLVINEQGYWFYRYVPLPKAKQRHWQPLPNDRLSQPQAFHGRYQIKVQKDNRIIVLQPDGTLTPFTLQLTSGQQAWDLIAKRNGLTRVIEHAKPKNEAGFTLIEVLIALVILAIALVAVVNGIQTSILSTSRVSEQVEAHWVGLNVLAQCQVGLTKLPQSQKDVAGDENLLGQDYHWRVHISQGGSHYYQRVEVAVSLHDRKITSIQGFVRANRKETHDEHS